MIKADYHVHSDFSSDSDTPMELMVERGIELGLDRICFTDHMDLDFPKTYAYSFTFDPEAYLAKIQDLKEKYHKKIKILTGIELGLRPYLAEDFNQLMKKYSFDFAICSSHLVGDADPFHPEYWEAFSEEEGITNYFQTIIDNIHVFQNFDVYGHIDYVVRYAPNKNMYYTFEKYQDILEQALKAIIQAGKGIEINTSGYKYGLDQPHPQSDIIKRYIELGGDIITIGSDGHKTEHLAYDFDKAKTLLQSLGTKYYTVFEQRKPLFFKL